MRLYPPPNRAIRYEFSGLWSKFWYVELRFIGGDLSRRDQRTLSKVKPRTEARIGIDGALWPKFGKWPSVLDDEAILAAIAKIGRPALLRLAPTGEELPTFTLMDPKLTGSSVFYTASDP